MQQYSLTAAIAALTGMPAPRAAYQKKVREPQVMKPVMVKNQKIADNVNRLAERVSGASWPNHKEADPSSITSIKLKHRCHRSVARMMAANGRV